MEFSCTRDCGGLCRIVQSVAPNYFVLLYRVFTAAVLEMNCWYVSACPTKQLHLFQRLFINFLKEFLPSRLRPKKILYFSDGAASQYKNRKNFLNLCHHEEDFGVKPEWHFLATSRGM